MIGKLQQLEKDALAELATATIEEQILAVRTKYLGRKGLLTGLLRNIAQVPDEEKPLFGKRCNEVKESLLPELRMSLNYSPAGKKKTSCLKKKLMLPCPDVLFPAVVSIP